MTSFSFAAKLGMMAIVANAQQIPITAPDSEYTSPTDTVNNVRDEFQDDKTSIIADIEVIENYLGDISTETHQE